MRRVFAGIMVMLLILSFSQVGCGGGPVLEDARWILISYGDPETPYAVLPDIEVTARFNSGTKQVRGVGGCNLYAGEYEIDGDNLTIKGPFAVTEMWCGDDVGAQEKAYLDILLAAESYEAGSDILVIYSGDSVLYFEREETD